MTKLDADRLRRHVERSQQLQCAVLMKRRCVELVRLQVLFDQQAPAAGRIAGPGVVQTVTLMLQRRPFLDS